jgi:serine protease Do
MTGSGSGFVYKKDSKYGYIMTNYHVIDGATSVKIRLSSGENVEGEVLGGDKYMDIAVIKIDAKDVISVAAIGSTEKLKLGETVFAIGTPVDEEYFNTVTGGYVSGLNRKMKVSVESTNDWVQDVLQIDVAINPGNSGGALFNFNGEVIGVTSMKLVNQQIEGMGFAIKIEDAMKHIETFEKGKEIERPFLGISYIDVSQKSALQYYGFKIDSSLEEGVVVAKIESGSDAEKAGLKKGDVITKVNDDNVSSSANLRYLLYKYNVGDTIKVTYNRDGKTLTASIKLTDKK